MTQGIRSSENQLWLVVQVLQESLVSPDAVLLGNTKSQEREEKQIYRSHEIPFYQKVETVGL